jgi:hypothetical protein
MPLPLLLDWVYAMHVQNMDEKQRTEFDSQLDAILNAEEIRQREKERRRELARLNAQRPGL